jgi:GT2 family glycosyltransferase
VFDEPDDPRSWLEDPPTVAAVLVAHDGMAWLPKVLGSIATMEHAPTAWHAVDVASTDGSGDLLRASFGEERLSYAPSGTGFGAAVALAVERLPRTDWIWLLHDDSAVEPDTLARLLDEATSAGDDVAVVGPKLREWPSLRRLLEVGVTVSGTARRETGLETGEPDAGQHDRPRDVLAVSSAGMLVRRDAWDALGGFSPDLPMFGDDLDLGWRAARAGYRVRVAPQAVVFHAEATARRARPRSAGDVAPHEERRAMLFLTLAHVTGRRAAVTWWRLLVGSFLRTLGFLLAQAPEEAGDELQALRDVYLHPRAVRRARAERAAAATVPHARLRHLFPSPWLPYLRALDTVREWAAALLRPESMVTTGRRSSVLDPEPEDVPDEGPSLWRRRPWLLTVLLVVAVTLVASRDLLSGPYLHGGAMLPAPRTAGGWWELFLAGGHDVGLGTTASAPPMALLLAAVATPVWLAPNLVTTALVVGAVPLAALTAHRFVRLFTDRRGLRILAAVGYAAALAASGAVAEGRVGTLVAAVVAPIVAGVAVRLWFEPRWQRGVALGVWVAVAAAFAPIAYWLALPFVVALALRRTRPAVVAAATGLALPLVLLGSWTWQRVLAPARVWWEAGLPVPADASAVELLLGRASEHGAPLGLAAGVLVLALAALLAVPARERAAVLVAWSVALVALAAGVAALFCSVVPSTGAAEVPAWAGLPAVLWTGALLVACVLAAEAVGPLRPVLTVPAVVVALVLPLGVGAWLVTDGAGDPVVRDRATPVPAYLGDRDATTLVLTGRLDGPLRAEVVRGSGPFLGQEALRPDAGRRATLLATVEALVAGTGAAQVSDLTAQGVDAVYLPQADRALAQRLDALPGLRAAGSDDPASRVWTTEGAVLPDPGGSWWRTVVAGVQAVAWLAAIVLTAPVRRRRKEALR